MSLSDRPRVSASFRRFPSDSKPGTPVYLGEPTFKRPETPEEIAAFNASVLAQNDADAQRSLAKLRALKGVEAKQGAKPKYARRKTANRG